MKKRTKKAVLALALAAGVVGLGGLTVQAATVATYFFVFHTKVVGDYKYLLQEKQTSTTARGTTYLNGSPSAASAGYKITLNAGVFGPSYNTPVWYADWGSETDSFGTIKNDTYRIIVEKMSGNTEAIIKGSGRLDQ